MKCLVCNNNIRISTLKQLYSFGPLFLCTHCSQNLVPKSADVLYHDNEWMRTVINKLNQGDLALIQIFKKDLHKTLLKKKITPPNIKIIEAKKDLPYPWLEILVDSIRLDLKNRQLTSEEEPFVVAVEKQKNVSNQVSFIG